MPKNIHKNAQAHNYVPYNNILYVGWLLIHPVHEIGKKKVQYLLRQWSGFFVVVVG